MPMLIVLLVLVVLVVFLINSDKKPNQKSNSTNRPSVSSSNFTHKREILVRTLDIPDDDFNGTYETKIAGISYHCKKWDAGIYKGVIYVDSGNPHNPNAMAIATIKGKLVGYIQDSELDRYSRWCDYQTGPCVLFIKSFINDEGREIVFGRVTAIKPCNSSFVEKNYDNIIYYYEDNEYPLKYRP